MDGEAEMGEAGDLWNGARLVAVALVSATLSATLVIGIGSAVMKAQTPDRVHSAAVDPMPAPVNRNRQN